MQRDTCIFYRSFLTAVDLLPEMNERVELLMAIIRYSLDQQEPSFSSVTCSIAWELIKPIIDKEWTCYVNGKKGGCPRGIKKPSMLGNKNASKNSSQKPNKTQTKADKDEDVDKDGECDKDEIHSVSVFIRPHETANGGRRWSQEDLSVYDDADKEVKEMFDDPMWRTLVFSRFKFLSCSDETLKEYLERFAREQKIGGKHHQHLGDAKNHFVNWMIIQEEKLNKKSRIDGTDSNNGYRTREDIYKGAIRVMGELKAEGSQPHEELPVV